jgi:xanthosine utilization system XapX-like protein
MTDADPREQIALLEARIEALAETTEHCQKLILVSKIAMAVGALLLAGFAFGVVGSSPMPLLLAIIGILGGVVVFGANTSTAESAMADMQAAESHRAELIGMIELQVVESGAGARLLH